MEQHRPRRRLVALHCTGARRVSISLSPPLDATRVLLFWAAGLNRTGKSCRLRWLNYLHPDVRRGNMTAEEQELIVQLQARWGNKYTSTTRVDPPVNFLAL